MKERAADRTAASTAFRHLRACRIAAFDQRSSSFESTLAKWNSWPTISVPAAPSAHDDFRRALR